MKKKGKRLENLGDSNHLKRWKGLNINSVVFLLILSLVFALIIITGNLTAGPRVVDDNQIYRLQIDLTEKSFLSVAIEEIKTRILYYKRVVPVFSFHKVFQSWLLGKNLFLWSIYTGLLGVFSAFFLFLFCRKIDYSIVESIVFSMVSTLGLQSVLWWKLIHGEGIAMFFLSLALLFMGLSINASNQKGVYKILFLTFAILASLSKESFLLILPALIFWRVWLVSEFETKTFKNGIKENFLMACILFGFFIMDLIFIKYINPNTSFDYAGWEGFKPALITNTVFDFLRIANPWLILFPLIAFLAFLFTKPIKLKKYLDDPNSLVKSFLLPLILFFLIVFPQILLYSKSGFYKENDHFHYINRYLLPAMIGYAFLTVFILRLIRYSISNHYFKWARITWITSVCVVFLFLGSKLSLAYKEGFRYAEFSAYFKKWYDSIEKNTEPTDKILIVFPNLGPREFIRVKYILNEMLDRHNLYFHAYPEEPFSTWMDGTPEINNAAQKARWLDEIENKQEIDAVLLIVPSGKLQKEFLDGSKTWLNPFHYKINFHTGLDYKSFYRVSLEKE